MKIMAIVLAGGMGKRMKSKLYKVLHPVCGKPMVGHVAQVVKEAGSERTVVVVGHGAEKVKAYLGDGVEYALQEQQLGTGHAVLQAKELLSNEEGITLVVYGDTPLIRTETIEAMLKLHQSGQSSITMLTALMDNPTGYGRVIRDQDGNVLRNVEQKDCSPEEAAVKEINVGAYCFDNKKLFWALSQLKNDNAQGEYYLTDVISILQDSGATVQAYCTDDVNEAIGVNDRAALSEAERYMRQRINLRHMLGGVTIIDPDSTYIEADVKIGADTYIYPGSVLRGTTVIGEDCHIGPQADITNSLIQQGVAVKYSTIDSSEVGNETTVGPYANLRPGTVLGQHCKVGDFVELKNAVLNDGSKVSHLSYVGDAEVGKDVNIGCGAITVNYDGYNKAKTVIGDNAFIGSNVNLIAPVNIGEGAYVVAGTTVTQDVPAGDLAIARERQSNKSGYAEKIRARAKAKKERSEKQE